MAIPSITHNSPSAGSIAWGAFTIQLNGVAYAVPAASSNQRWVWWEYKNGAPIINAGADVPTTLTDDDLVLFGNKNGIGVRVQSTNFVDGELLVDGSIFADALSTNLINSNHIVTAGLDAGVIKFGTMHGDRISVNTLSGDRIIAKSLYASQLAITDFNNYVADPFFTLGQWPALTGVAVAAITDMPMGMGAGNVLRFTGGGTRDLRGATQQRFNVTPAEVGYASVWVRKTTATASPVGSVAIRVRHYDAAGANTTPFYLETQLNNSAMVQNTWYEVIIDPAVLPTGRVSAVIDLLTIGVNATDTFEFAVPSFYKQSNGKLIVDGTINSNHVVTAGLDAQVIKFGTMSGDRIAANTINSGHVVTAGLDAGIIKFGSMSGDRILANTINSGHVVTAGLDAGIIKFGSMSGDRILANTINSGHVVTAGLDASIIKFGQMSGDRIVANTINSNHVVTAGLDASIIKFGQMSGDRIVANTINSNHVVTTGLDAAVIKFGTMSGDRILANTISSGHVVTAGLDAAVIKFGLMSGERIQAESITAGHLETDVILANTRIAAQGPAGQSVELNPDGFFVYGPTSEGNPPYISFPSTGSAEKPNVITGTLQATTLAVEGNEVTGQAATFRRNSQMEPGATLTLNDAIVAPVSAPTVAATADEIGGSAQGSGAWIPSAMGYNTTDDCIYYVTYESTPTGPGGTLTYTNKVYKISQVNGAVSFVSNVSYGSRTDMICAGIQKLGSVWVLLWRVTGAAPNEYYIASHNPASAWVSTSGVSLGYLYGLGKSYYGTPFSTDGTNVWVATMDVTAPNGSDQYIRFRKYAGAANSAAVMETISTTQSVPLPVSGSRYPTELTGLTVGNMDFGARKFVVGVRYGVFLSFDSQPFIHDIYVFNTTGGREAASDFDPMRMSGFGLDWRGTSVNDTAGYFLSMTLSNYTPTIQKYTKIKLAAATATFKVASSFYRSSDGAETAASPTSTLTMKSRWAWKATVTQPPKGLGSRVYVGVSDTTLKLEQTIAADAISVTSSTYLNTGAAPKTASTFPSGTPSLIVSQAMATRNIPVTTSIGSTTITTTTATPFMDYMVGRKISGTGIPTDTVISAVASTTSATMSKAATTAGLSDRVLTLPKVEIRGDGLARIREMERVILSSSEDADTTATNEPALRVGNITGSHLRVDGNEIIAMSDSVTRGTLNLNMAGHTNFGNSGTIYVGTSVETPTIKNPNGAIILDPVNGKIRVRGHANYVGFIGTDNGTGAALVFQGGDVVLVQDGYTATATTATNTRQLWCDRVQAYRAYNVVSDMSVKSNIVNIDTPSAKMKALQPRKYRRTDYPAGDPRAQELEFGFIAQEVQKVLPEAVTSMGDGLLGLNYQAIFTVGMAALAELIGRVEALERR